MMNDTTNNGGPASAEKIDMRDYFAAKAMQSYLLDKDRDSFTFEQWANAAYEMADAMLKARGQA